MTSVIRICSGPVLCSAAFGMCLALGAGPAQAQKTYEGVEVNLLTRPGPVIAGRLEERGKEFEEMTGARINVSSVPFADLFQKLLTDWATGTNSIDVGVFASGWAVEMVDGGLLADLSDFVANDPELKIDDVAPYFREFNQKIDGKTYLITIDGDFQMVYYRKDVLDELGLQPPKTWDEYLEVAAAANGKDMNGDGEADFGSCMFKKRNAQSFYAIMSIAAPFVQTQGTGQGIFFDTEDMTPMVNNEAWARAFEIYKETGKYGPPEELNHDIGDTRALVTSGRCALVIDWGDIGPLSIDPTTSKVKDLVGAVILPGSTRGARLGDRRAGRLHARALPPRHRRHQPRAVRGVRRLVGRDQRELRPQGDRGGLRLPVLHEPAGAVERRRHASAGPATTPTASRSSRTSSPWVEAGFSQEFAENYLGAIGDSLNSPNMTSDLRIPGTQRYEGIVLDRELARYLAGEVTAEEALQNVHDGWEEITEEFGRDEQLELYKASLGITN